MNEPEETEGGSKELKGEFSNVVRDKPLWMEIVRFLDSDDLERIDSMPELEGMAKLVTAEQHTVYVLQLCGDTGLLDHGYNVTASKEALLRQVEDKGELWCEWWFSWVEFSLLDEPFREYKAMELVASGPNWIKYLSKDAKVLIYRDTSNRSSWIYGERERVNWLVKWLNDRNKVPKCKSALLRPD